MVLFLVNLITAIFIGLKLSNVIAWSWLIVLSPTILLVALLGFMLIIGFITMIVIATYDAIRSGKYD